jgi:TonB family protein
MTLSMRLAWAVVLSVVCIFASSLSALAQAGGEEKSGVVVKEAYAPHYPPMALAGGIKGVVRVRVHIANDGSVASVELLSGHPFLSYLAVKSAKNWKFTVGKERQAELEFLFEPLRSDAPKEEVEVIFRLPYQVIIRDRTIKIPDVAQHVTAPSMPSSSADTVQHESGHADVAPDPPPSH